MVSITLRCKAPKRLSESTFNSFRALYLWVLRNFKNPSYANHLIIPVAERGIWREYKYGKAIEITSSSVLGYRAKEMARHMELLRPAIGGNRYSRKEKKGLEFAEAVDKILN